MVVIKLQCVNVACVNNYYLYFYCILLVNTPLLVKMPLIRYVYIVFLFHIAFMWGNPDRLLHPVNSEGTVRKY